MEHRDRKSWPRSYRETRPRLVSGPLACQFSRARFRLFKIKTGEAFWSAQPQDATRDRMVLANPNCLAIGITQWVGGVASASTENHGFQGFP